MLPSGSGKNPQFFLFAEKPRKKERWRKILQFEKYYGMLFFFSEGR